MNFDVVPISIFGNPNIGVYMFANDDFALIPPGVKEDVVKKVESALKVTVVEAKVADSTLLGLFVNGNNHALVVPSIIKEYELENLKRELDLPIKVVYSKLTAMGNVILCNDKFALFHPEMSNWVKDVTEVLGVPGETGTIAGVPTVGSVAVINDKGGLVHPDASDEELNELEKKFQVVLDIGTVNYGVPYVKTGLVANNKGAVVGDLTTGVEMARVARALSGE
ncbi:translation initiation factor IF-6 [Ignicoccus hospitalis]|uniref:Translation initiation factor 6 n=1 Tax=Ignicoccus hospitalis (strain KIN4/I / DSM 18386 / JCM 14125) TaxID=453591 RepID=A8A969_IGNH4|nr:translation initiation factor IF-6 [Ignicoccus hospitalis]ABU81471.1 translation initiation factor 6 (aeIF-6) [Ignicoccus hospitalis KIN4/I]HIH90222.1 translation initiation factor IF-6 [Desulfurococcaceae archaeon]